MLLSPHDLTRDLYWLLELEWGGQTWRFSTNGVDAPFGSQGADVHYYAGLDFSEDYFDSITLFGGEPTERSVSVNLWTTLVPDLDPPTMVERGHELGTTLGSATGRLYLWPEDSTRRLLVIEGQIEEPEYGTAREPISFTVSERPWEDQGRFPAITARVDDDTWPNHDADIAGEYYPWVIGQPGVSGSLAYGSPGLVVDAANNIVLIAGHATTTGNVEVYNETTGNSGTYATSLQSDGLGRQCTVVDCTGIGGGGSPPAPDIEDGDEIWVIWTTAAGLDGGAGDVLEYMLRESSLRWDRGRVRASTARLNGHQIDCYIQAGPDERVVPFEWISEHLLPILPTSVRTSEHGLYLAVFDLEGTQPVEYLTAERNCTRISPVTYLGTSEVANDFRISYAPRAQEDKGHRYRRVTGDRAVLRTDSTAVRSAACVASVDRYGVRPDEMVSSVIYDSTTAGKTLSQKARTRALPAREVSYQIEQSLCRLEPGNIIALTDSDLGWEDKLAHVWALRWHPTAPEITLRMYDVPSRDWRA